jgi:hypothetical protein
MSTTIRNLQQAYNESTTFEKMSYIPLASNVKGIASIAQGIFMQLTGVLMILSGKNLFGINQTAGCSNRFMGLQVLGAGLAFVGRGIIEQVPVIGNLALLVFDDWFDHECRDNPRNCDLKAY